MNNDDSSDDDDVDLLATFRALKQRNEQQKNQMGSNGGTSTSMLLKQDRMEATSVNPTCQNSSSKDLESSPKPAVKCHLQDDDNSERDEPPSEDKQLSERTLDKSLMPHEYKQLSEKTLDKSLMDDSSIEQDDVICAKRKNKRTSGMAHNPLTLMKEQQERQHRTTTTTVASDTNATRKEAESSLWSDSENEQQPESQKPKKKRSGKQTKRKRSSEEITRARSGAKSAGVLDLINENDDDDDDDKDNQDLRRRLQLDEDTLQTMLQPDFLQPRFGPFAFEPLLLEGEDGVVRHKVPASMNRYLLPYQREGVQFLYKALSARKGAILGDEMVRVLILRSM